MATRNDITGDLIKTKANGDDDAYADGWERIFGKKNKVADAEAAPNQPVEPTPADLFDEERIDTIGQNGNIGYGEDAS